MQGRQIDKSEQQCLSRCITTHWGAEAKSSSDRPEERERSYQACLEACQICG